MQPLSKGQKYPWQLLPREAKGSPVEEEKRLQEKEERAMAGRRPRRDRRAQGKRMEDIGRESLGRTECQEGIEKKRDNKKRGRTRIEYQDILEKGESPISPGLKAFL